MVLLILVAASLDALVERYRSESRDWGAWARAQAVMASARDEALFAMATRQLSPWGFGEGPGAIRADGRAYRTQAGAWVSVQDERGLIGLNVPNLAILRNFLLDRGVPDREVEPLLDTLADYTDTDSLHRLNGAEAEAYAVAGLPPPRNDWLVSPHEIRQILRWREFPQVWSRAGDVFSAARGEPFNANNAPREVLEALPGATPEGVSALLARREIQPFTSVAELRGITGIRLNEADVLLHPGVLYRLRVGVPGGLPALEYHIILNPGGLRAPWTILEVRQIAHPGRDDAKPTISPLPLPYPTLAAPDADALPSPPP
jgi:DNA uptake protein ComE-like DNA-binding protein